MVKNLQFVWPKDGPKGRSGHRGFFGRLDNILSGTGPDVFIQRNGSKSAIRPDRWGNWDSYHHITDHHREGNGRFSAHRGFERYDPHSRKYKEWASPHDWFGDGVNAYGPGLYPRLTASEKRRMGVKLDRGREIDPERMGDSWSHFGPKRFRQQHDWFWQNAHRIGENRREGFPLSYSPNPFLRMHQQWPDDVEDWMFHEHI